MGKAAIRAAQAVNYSGAERDFCWMGRATSFQEMNTRIQEHPVTEMATGVDLSSGGSSLPGRELTISRGCQQESPSNAASTPKILKQARPSPGTALLLMPGGPGIPGDAAIYAGCTIPPYDSMMAKLIAFAPAHKRHIAKMRWALAEFVVDGVDTNIDFQLGILRNPEFETGDYHIGTLSQWLEEKQKC